jgi:hypothetical protein
MWHNAIRQKKHQRGAYAPERTKMKFINRLMLLLIVVVPCVTFIAWRMNLLEPPPRPPKIQVKEAGDYCAQLTGYDDGLSDDERLAMAVAAWNLAKSSGQSTCDVYRHFKTLIGPDSQTWVPWFRETPVMYSLSRVSEDRLQAFNQTGLLLSAYLKDPKPYLEKMPWLTCVTHYIRSKWPFATPWPDYSLREKMNKVWTSPIVHYRRQAEFFCPK